MPARIFRLFISLGIAAWLGVHAVVLALNVLGDSHRHPLTYFFTWDMFPGSDDVSRRRVALATTRSGATIQLYPNPTQQFREGVRANLTRADLDRSGMRFPLLVDHALDWAGPRFADDPLVKVTLLEEYWPSRLNMAPELSEAWSGEPQRQARYWQVLETRDLSP